MEGGVRATTEGKNPIAVYGASGHTGRFVIAELRRRGLTSVAIGRDAQKLAGLHADAVHVAALDDPAALERAFAGAAVIINCAGPFLDTAAPVIAAALRANASYLDITAEQQSARDSFSQYANAAWRAGIKLVPAAGFYGALADLLAHAAMRDWRDVDTVRTHYALDRWHPTEGTRITGARNNVPRVRLANRALVEIGRAEGQRDWDFPAPFRHRKIEEIPFSEIVLLARDRRIADARSFINASALADVRDPATPTRPEGRSREAFMVEVVVGRGAMQRRAAATGEDIYAVTAPIVVEAAVRIADGRTKVPGGGAFAPNDLFEPRDFLAAVAARYPGFHINYC